MGSFKGDKRKPGRERRRPIEGSHATRPTPESLESRTLLAGNGLSQAELTAILTGPLSKDHHLAELYANFRQGPEFLEKGLARNQGLIVFRGDKVGIDIFAKPENFSRYVNTLRELGMDIVASDARSGVVEGFLPISQLQSVAGTAGTLSLGAIYRPTLKVQGVANNQAEQVLQADVAKAQFNVDGTGVTVGVLSDTVNQFAGGLADSQATGDLPANINVLLDGPADGTDEGRAMLELIYDIAPGASLAYNTAVAAGPASFADGIRALSRQAGADVIVDDIGFIAEPVYQDGLVSQAINDVVNVDGRTYFSAAGNDGFGGIDTNFRGVTATVNNVGAGLFQDFDPGPGVATSLSVTITNPNLLFMQWDDPWYNGQADSNVDFFLLDGNGNVVTSGISNNIGSAQPEEVEAAPPPGTYSLVIRATAGPAPGRIRFQAFGTDLTVDQQFGLNDGTFYPTTYDHSTAEAAIGVGAVPFFNPAASEPFSSAGPALRFFDPAGNRLPARQLLLKPDVSGIDGVNTTFFPPGGDIPQDPDDFPNFFGTSAAAPNLAAVAALMKQLNPDARANEIRDAMISSAAPLNGSAPGTYDRQGGFGLVNAVGALTAVDQLRVVATAPLDAQALTSAPSFIDVAFSKPVDAASVQATDLVFIVTPPGITVSVGTPVLINPQTVRFPITINATNPEALSSGTFAYQLADGSIAATDGSALVGLTRAFVLNDAVAPRVINTIFRGRIIVVEFSEAMRGSTINQGTVQLVRTGGSGSFGRLDNVVVTDDPRAIFFYDAANNRAIYDLRNLPQSVLPSDVYALTVTDAARDASGNPLDGEFSGTFPSGDGSAGGNFVQPLGGLFVLGPQITGLGLAPGSDTGIVGDQNTLLVRPNFNGFVVADFPATNAGLQVAIQYIQEHPGGFDLDVGPNGQGFVGNPDQIVTTGSDGSINFTPPFDLRDGFQRVRVVVIGEADFPPLPGRATRLDFSFRVDTTGPLVTASSVPQDSRIPNLRNITLNFADPISPADPTSILAVPTQLDFPALDPSTASNLSNYSLINLGPDRVLGTVDDLDLSRFIAGASYISTTNRGQATDPYTGRVELTFVDGLASGRYVLVARTAESVFSGIRDAAGNPLDNDPAQPGNQSFATFFDLQPEAAFITSYNAFSTSVINPGTAAASGIRSFYEIPVPGFVPRAEAPPEMFSIDFSNTLEPRDYTGAIRLVRSANTAGGVADGDFDGGLVNGLLGGLGTASTEIAGLTVTLTNSVPGATIGQPGFNNRLEVRLPAGVALPADYYRFIVPNTDDQIIRDIFGNQADLEMLGNQQPTSGDFEVFLPDGTYRRGLTGDTIQGGSFVTGFTVVPGQRIGADGRIRGNVIYARPDYQDDPFLANDDPDGSVLRPFPTLVPEANSNLVNGGDLNAQSNFGTGFNPLFDRNANGRFDRSAFFEATQVSNIGPAVIVAQPGILRPVPGTTNNVQTPFVIAPAAGLDPRLASSNASASVPGLTTLVFNPGSTLKLFNASLFVQNQGSALQVRGGVSPTDQVIITSLLDDSVGGDTNNDATDTAPNGGDWGGIVFRNYNDVSNGRSALPGAFPVDGKLGLSGASDVLSEIDHSLIRFGGGVVPQTIGIRYDSVTLFNSRPAISNTTIGDSTTGAGGTQAAISADVDSLREDAIARGPLIRRTNFANNSINGLLIRPQIGSLQSQESDAVFYAPNPTSLGGGKNFTIDDPVPYVLASQLVLGQRLIQNTGGSTDLSVSNRLYVQPGMLLKSRRGANIALLGQNATINIGDRNYIRQYDVNPAFGPTDVGFEPNTSGDAMPLLTSLADDAAETFFFDPTTGVRRVIVPANATDNVTGDPAPQPNNVTDALRWGNLSVIPGARAVIDEAIFRYGGGNIIAPTGSLESRSVLDLSDDTGQFSLDFANAAPGGAFVSVTNNDFFDNLDAPIVVEPDQLLATDPLRPLVSGNPFLRGNVLQRNDINGLAINTTLGVQVSGPTTEFLPGGLDIGANISFDTAWDDTDIVHVVRGSIIFDGYYYGQGIEPSPDGTAFGPEELPSVALTIESAVPDKLLANGDRIARPGESIYVKLLNEYTPAYLGPGDAVDPDLATPAADDALEVNVGAGFVLGYDDGVDPDASPTIPEGVGAQLRFVGVSGNESIGAQRVPVVVTSLRDATVGPVVRGVDQSNTFARDAQGRFTGAELSTPAPGDGGVIAFGSTMLTDYNLLDPRDGSLIDNTDLRFLTRIDVQGGNIFDAVDLDANDTIDLLDDWRFQKLGLDPTTQFNSANSMTISNSNIADFRDAGVFAYPGFGALVRIVDPVTGTGFFPEDRTGLRGQPVNLFLVNNTFANLPVAVRINGEVTNGFGQGDQGQNPFTATLLNNTFYNNGAGLHTQTIAFNGNNSLSHVYFLAMDNIFDGGTIGSDPNAVAIRIEGQATSSEATFNLFDNYTTNFLNQTNTVNLGNKNAVLGPANFFDAANGNFFLRDGSAAIDAGLSELGPVAIGDSLFPIVNQVLNETGGTRNTIGRSSAVGGIGAVDDPRKIVTLPGTPGRPFFDKFIAVEPGSPGSIPGPATTLAGPWFLPIGGERDQAGFLRLDDPNSPNLGFGSRPFFDIGARENRTFDPPVVTGAGAPDADGDGTGDAVFATVADGLGTTSLVNLYTIGGISGTIRTPQTIQIQFDERLDANTITNQTVLLQASGGDGIFGNNNSTADRFIDLSGKLAFDPDTRRLSIGLGSTNLILTNDLYRIVLVGTGGNVIRDPQGTALDGENLDANGLQRALPSGDGFPGGNFIVNFTIDTNPPVVTPGSFTLAVAADPGLRDGITNVQPPMFTGNITDVFPPLNATTGQLVRLDIDSDGDGNFERLNVATARTDANGNFTITVGQDAAGLGIDNSLLPLPDSLFNVGPDGILGTPDDSGFSLARVRVFDTSGNPSDINDTSAIAGFLLDTKGPRITAATPASNSLVTPGQFTVSFTADENIFFPSLQVPGAITAVGAGQDGIFGTADDNVANVDLSSLNIEFLGGTPMGPSRVTFNVTGANASDVYRVSITDLVTDRATNAIDGEFNGGFPTGNGVPGGAFNLDVIVFNPGQQRTLFVGAGFGVGDGSRNNPFPTITAGLAAASVGDTVAVLPGTYNEAVTLKSLVRLVSAAASSTDSNVVRGRAQSTIIRAPLTDSAAVTTVTGTGLAAAGTTLISEFSGFAVASPLSNLATGQILPESVGLRLTNSSGFYSDNIFFDAGIGASVLPNEGGGANARFENNVFVGNLTGLFIDDRGNTNAARQPVEVVNNDFALNNGGAVVVGNSDDAVPDPIAASFLNNIFWQNRDRETSSTELSLSVFPGIATVRSNLFSSADGLTPFLGFDPGQLGTIPNPSANANFIGDPAFIAPRDPRPGFDGPTVFLLDANFNIGGASAAIDAALDAAAPDTDALGRGRVDVANRNFPGLGPADIGAFEFQGTSATNPGGGGGFELPGGGGGITDPGLFGIGSAAQTAAEPAEPSYTVTIGTDPASLTTTAGQTRRDRDALRNLLAARSDRAKVAPQGLRNWMDLISRARNRRGS